eukprot:scaffold2319_cov350-Pavlova_lutheri.AAC.11
MLSSPDARSWSWSRPMRLWTDSFISPLLPLRSFVHVSAPSMRATSSSWVPTRPRPSFVHASSTVLRNAIASLVAFNTVFGVPSNGATILLPLCACAVQNRRLRRRSGAHPRVLKGHVAHPSPNPTRHDVPW